MNKNRNELIDTKETHQQSQLKDEQMDNIKRALGVKNDYVLGAAFDLELQEQKKEERKSPFAEYIHVYDQSFGGEETGLEYLSYSLFYSPAISHARNAE